MENEFFSMLLNFDSGSFQSVPDILRSNSPPHTTTNVNNNNQPLFETKSVPLPIKQQQQLQTPQVHFPHETQFESNNYPLDMQFPSILRSEKEDLQQPKKVTKKGKSTPKKRKQAQTESLESQQAKLLKVSEHDFLEDDNSDHEETNKRQRRLVKNREAAQLFRQRQKAYIQNLEKKVNDLNFENQQHRSKVELLTTENRLLSDQLSYLRTFISGVISMAFPNGQPPNLNLSSILPQFDLNSISGVSSQSTSPIQSSSDEHTNQVSEDKDD